MGGIAEDRCKNILQSQSSRKEGTPQTGSGAHARTVGSGAASQWEHADGGRLAPASGTRRGRLAKGEGPSGMSERAAPPVLPLAFRAARGNSHSPAESSQWDFISQWDLQSSYWEVAAFPVGKVQAPTREVTARAKGGRRLCSRE